jgi:hypothetical protein
MIFVVGCKSKKVVTTGKITSLTFSFLLICRCQWFSPGTPVSSTNKTDCHDITDILLKVALNTKTLTLICCNTEY